MNGHAEARRRGPPAQRVRARAQVSHLAQILEGRTFGLNWVCLGIVDPPNHFDRVGLHLDRLALPLTLHEHTTRHDRASRRQFPDLALVVRQLRRRHNLDGIEAGAVVHVDERQASLGVAARAHPAAY